MKRLIGICAILVLIQTGLTIATHVIGRDQGPHHSKGPLLAIEPRNIDQVVLADDQGNSLVLDRRNGRWLLPATDNFPADSERVEDLIARLSARQRGWPEAATAEAANRFKVAADRFERMLRLRREGKDLSTLYFGTAPSLRRIYLRVDGDQEIHSLAMSQHELSVKADDWIDPGVLKIEPGQIVEVDLPGLRLKNTPDGLQPSDLKDGEEVVGDLRDALIKRLCGLTINGLLGKEGKPEFGLEQPILRYTLVLKDGKLREYRFGRQQAKTEEHGDKGQGMAPGAGPVTVLKVSDHDQFFKMDGWQVDEIRNISRSALVRDRTVPQAPAAASQPDAPGQ